MVVRLATYYRRADPSDIGHQDLLEGRNAHQVGCQVAIRILDLYVLVFDSVNSADTSKPTFVLCI